ncbi:hypothetical protein EDD18DRAFT_1366705 [Armillaria luteobubalina]|uniref:Uncharacterized protein n=1 Tax=Armillaria luteobubalina TaxID=153913 RepID=A0AA39P2I2_9AGAR|nr:hypothetical protein EDD18DRAFT_1366705 [Armillaria luteobubalina]
MSDDIELDVFHPSAFKNILNAPYYLDFFSSALNDDGLYHVQCLSNPTISSPRITTTSNESETTSLSSPYSSFGRSLLSSPGFSRLPYNNDLAVLPKCRSAGHWRRFPLPPRE